MGFEKPEENLVEDVNAARVGAEAENPARSSLAEHRAELSEEQQKTLEWFATSEGEKALAGFEQSKEKQKNLVRERTFNLLKIDPEVQLADKITEYSEEGGRVKKEQGTYKEEKERVLRELNDELVPAFFKERVDGILSNKKDLAKKLEEVEKVKRFFTSGVFPMVVYKSVPIDLPSYEEEDKESYFYGLLAPCLVKKVWPMAADVLSFADRKFGVNFDGLVEKVGDKLSEGHSDEKLNREMEAHNYIFNPEKNRYEKVEG